VRTWPSGVRTRIAALWTRSLAVPVGLVAVGLLVVFSGGVATGATRAPQPSVSQVQAQLSSLNAKAQVIDEQYDAAQQQLNSADQQLAAINTEIKRDQARFKSMHKQMADIAATFYENGTLNTPELLLTSGNPQKILDQSSILLELTSLNNDQIDAFLTAARQLTEAQQAAARVEKGKLAVRNQLASEKAANDKLVSQEQALLSQLTEQQAAAVGLGSGVAIAQGPNGATPAAQKAIAFAEAQLGCPYVYGGTGPCDPSEGLGFDCSGLTQQAWAAAGVSIERTSYEQMDEFPAVPLNELEPGDILGFLGNSHVALYIGNNQMIQSPQTGEDVDVEDLTGWFAENLDGAVNPQA
jgi:peptidoglycan DL-endopeptidase CwlO